MKIATQSKLLRVLDNRRVGGSSEMAVNVRVLATSNRDLENAGRFRADLYYRLNVMTIEMPPLRKRVEDIPLLVDHLSASSQLCRAKA